MRDQIRLDNLWQAQPISANSRSVFVPAPWEGTEVRLIPLEGAPVPLRPPTLTYGAWNHVEGNAPLHGARLVASPPLHVKRVQCIQNASELGVEIDLTRDQVCLLHVTLSDSNGELVTRAYHQIGEPGGHLRTNLELPADIRSGFYRLKVVMTVGDQIVDNARIEVFLSV